MGKKRGQITIFIIVGIILMIVTALFLHFREETIPLEQQEKIPSEFVPIRNFIEECMQVHAKEGVYLLGVQGGYAYIPDEITNVPDSFVSMDKRGYMKIPYWYYKEKNRVPSFDEMKENLELHMDENLRYCLNEFVDFKDKFTVEEIEPMKTEVLVTDNELIYTTNYPIRVKEIGTEKSVVFSVFRATLPVKLRRIYELAVDMMKAENEQMFFEDLTIDLMTLGPEIPFSDIEFKCSQVRWLKSEVEERVKNLLFFNVPRIRIENTDYTPYPLDSMYNYSIHHFLWNVGEENYKDLRAGISYYPYWPMVFNVRPSQGNIMRASFGKGSMEFLLDFICVNVYKFTYDVEYPLQAVIFDDDAFLGEGYSFRFAFPVMIKSNEGNRKDVDIPVFESPPDEGTDPCEDVSPSKFMIYAKDELTTNDLKDVNVTFICANIYECYLGETNPLGNFYGLETNLPTFCSPGRVKVEAKGYSPKVEELPADKMMNPSITVKMTPIKEFKFDVRRIRITDGVEMDEIDISKNQKALIILTTDDLYEYSEMRSYPFIDEGDDITPNEFRTISLALKEINYSLDVLLLSADDEFVGGWRGNFSPSMEELENNDFIKFKVFEFVPHPKSITEQAEMVTYIEGGEYVKKHKPVFTVGGAEPEINQDEVIDDNTDKQTALEASETLKTLASRCSNTQGKYEASCTGRFAAEVNNIELCYQAGDKVPLDIHTCIIEYAKKKGDPDACEESLKVGDIGIVATAQEMADKCKEEVG